jgi:hypothetical protein
MLAIEGAIALSSLSRYRQSASCEEQQLVHIFRHFEEVCNIDTTVRKEYFSGMRELN